MILDRTLRGEISREVTEALRGARVRRVHQPLPDTLVLTLRSSGEEHRLIVSADPARARMHLTSRKLQNPPAPPPFCMLARKHLEGRPFLGATAEPDLPVVHLRFGSRAGGKEEPAVLSLEMTGHAATAVLTTGGGRERGILGLMRPLPAARRDLSPGARYRLPRIEGRLDPLKATAESVVEGIARLRARDRGRAGRDPGRLLSRLFEGLGRQVAAEAVALAGLAGAPLPDPITVLEAGVILTSLRRLLATPCAPRVVTGGGEADALIPFPLPLTQPEGSAPDTLSEALDALCGPEGEARLLEAHRARTLRALKRIIEHRERKLDRQRGDLEKARDGERWRKEADLLLSQPGAGRRGLETIEVVNAFDPRAGTLRIAIDPALSLTENAERLYRRARKARRAVSILEDVIARGDADLRHLREQALLAAQAADAATLDAIAETSHGKADPVQRDRKGRGGPAREHERRAPEPGPRRFALEGWEVIVGRHGRENDRLVTRIGRPDDLWLHARNIPGAHVLLRRPTSAAPPERVLAGAARVAAYFSGARGERQAEVIVAPLGQVRKARGAPPGQVIVRESRTLRVPAMLPEGLVNIAGEAGVPAPSPRVKKPPRPEPGRE